MLSDTAYASSREMLEFKDKPDEYLQALRLDIQKSEPIGLIDSINDMDRRIYYNPHTPYVNLLIQAIKEWLDERYPLIKQARYPVRLHGLRRRY